MSVWLGILGLRREMLTLLFEGMSVLSKPKLKELTASTRLFVSSVNFWD